MKRRRRNVLLLLGELALCLVLGIGAVICQRTINQMYSEELDDNVFGRATTYTWYESERGGYEPEKLR